MGYYYPHWNVHLSDYGKRIEQPYEVIRIKWDSGFMDVVPPGIFEIEDTRSCLNKFRKLIRLSVMSDLEKGTNTLSAWRKAIKDEYDFQFRVFSIIQEQYDKKYAELVDNATQADKKRAGKLKQLQKHKSVELKRLDSRKARVRKCAEILEKAIAEIK